ncbi:MAG: adenosine kinase [Acidimicrobiales bacterium]
MPAPTYDVVGLGNALVDVISHEGDDFLGRHGLVKGSMALIDHDRAADLYGAMGVGTEMSGGSAANTVAGVASFGGRAAFVGKVSDDELGRVFAHDLPANGVTFAARPATGGLPTGRCLVVVTADAERTMSTFLGAGGELGPEDIAPAVIAAAQVVYLEGYLFDSPEAKEAYRTASRVAHEAGRRVALTLSDSFCVERHLAEWVVLVDEQVDVLFGNAEEVQVLCGSGFDEAVRQLRDQVEIAVITKGASGSVIVTADELIEVPAEEVESVVDTTGAGDLYAAGFLYGYTAGRPLAECGRLGSRAAAEVIGHTGARPLVPLSDLA